MPTTTQSRPGGRLLGLLFWIFVLSFAFDFRADVDFDGGGTGGSVAQYLFLLLALASGSAILLLGNRHLLQKPGVFLLAVWWGYLAYALVVALANGVPPDRFVRVIIPFALLGLAMAVAHVAACSRLTPWQIVFPVVVAATTNIAWRAFYGFAFKGVTLSTVRIEILSPGINWAFAYIGVALLLAPKFRKSTLPSPSQPSPAPSSASPAAWSSPCSPRRSPARSACSWASAGASSRPPRSRGGCSASAASSR